LSITAATRTLGAKLHFENTRSALVRSGTLFVAAPQQSATTGVFIALSPGTLEFAATYDFSSALGPTITGDGLVIVDGGATLTLPLDTAFSGTIQVDGTLVVAPPLDPANADILPAFSVRSPPVPEPSALALLACGAPVLFARRRRRN
jgi:hypothetical protein